MYLAAATPPSWAGIITAFASLFTAVGLVITAFGAAMVNRRTSRRLDRDQRLVAAKLAENQAETATQLAHNQQATSARLDVIHTLVNSTLSAALQSQLDAKRSELVTLLDNARLVKDSGKELSPERVAAIASLRRTVGDLSEAMRTRDDQTEYANMQIAEEGLRLSREQERQD